MRITDATVISIHAPRMGSDTRMERNATNSMISIHAPRMGSDAANCLDCWRLANFNPRSPHGERLRQAFQIQKLYISIHAPRMGSDLIADNGQSGACIFQSTLPAWGATQDIKTGATHRFDFNPRSPHGERQALRYVRCKL